MLCAAAVLLHPHADCIPIHCTFLQIEIRVHKLRDPRFFRFPIQAG